MNKNDTTALKGMAILFMLFWHLFAGLPADGKCTNLLLIAGVPLANILSRMAHPVEFYLILSGFGMYTVYSKNKQYNTISKIKTLYVHYWTTLLVFVPIGVFVLNYNGFDFTLRSVVGNVTGWYPTWNGVAWFLFPYACYMLLCKYLFRHLENKNAILVILLSLSISTFACFCISRFGSFLYSNWLFHMPIILLSFLFPFLAGAFIAKYSLCERIKCNQKTCVILLLLFISFRCCFATSAFHSVFASLFVVLFAKIKRPKWLDAFLCEMGKRSTSIWLTHAYFFYYFFNSFVYSFKYPIIIFIVLLAMSYLSAIIIDLVNRYLHCFCAKIRI